MGRHVRRRPLPVVESPVEILDLAEDGRGVARVDGKVTFVAGALPGERVRIDVLRSHREFDEAEAVAVGEPSADRVEPRCAHFALCGGCTLQHLDAAAQLRFRQKQLLDALERIGEVLPEQVAEPIAGPAWQYRRRARLGVRWLRGEGRALVGFRERNRPGIARLARCEVLDERVGGRLTALADLIGRLSIRERVPQIEVATSADVVALVLRVLSPPTGADRALLAEFAAHEDIVFYLQPGGPETVVPLTEPAAALHYVLPRATTGEPLRLRFAPFDFVQVNEIVGRAMVRQAVDWLAPRPGEPVLELFSGLGHFSLPLAAAGARVTAVEGDAGLVARARANATGNGLDIHVVQADLFVPDARAAWLRTAFESVLLDPPRAGAQEMLPLLAAHRPRRILYVSCHPGTLARDAGILVRRHGYRLTRAGVLDMFPHTAHVESMALFEARACATSTLTPCRSRSNANS